MFLKDPVYENINPQEQKTIRFVYISHFSEVNAQDRLIKAFKKMSNKNCEIVLAGSEDNEYLEKLKMLADGDDKISFRVGLNRDEVCELLSQSDVFVCSSVWEFYSISLLEAAAKGLTVITTNVGNAHLIPGVITINNWSEMPRMMDKVCEIPELRIEIGRLLHSYAFQEGRLEDKLEKLEGIMKDLVKK